MPVSVSSRYHGLPVHEITDSKNESHPAVAIRPSSQVSSIGAQYRHLVTGTEDIEYLAWKFYGSSKEWWRIAEANELRFPLDLSPGMSIIIPSVNDVGLVVRDRRF